MIDLCQSSHLRVRLVILHSGTDSLFLRRPRRQRGYRSWSACWTSTIRSSASWSVPRVTAAASTTWAWPPPPLAPRPTTWTSCPSQWRRPPPPAPPPPPPSVPSLAPRNTRAAGRWSARTVTEGALSSPSWDGIFFFFFSGPKLLKAPYTSSSPWDRKCILFSFFFVGVRIVTGGAPTWSSADLGALSFFLGRARWVARGNTACMREPHQSPADSGCVCFFSGDHEVSWRQVARFYFSIFFFSSWLLCVREHREWSPALSGPQWLSIPIPRPALASRGLAGAISGHKSDPVLNFTIVIIPEGKVWLHTAYTVHTKNINHNRWPSARVITDHC